MFRSQKLFQKSCSILCNFSLLLNIFIPYFVAIPAYAEEPTPTPIVETTPTPEVKNTPEITIAPEHTVIPTTTPTPEVTITPETTPTIEVTPSTTPTPTIEVTPEPVPTPKVSPEITSKPTLTNIPSPWTFEKVELNKEYVSPQNSEVKLTFTKLPEISGNIKIEEITLTSEQIKQTGSLSDKAYDITSDMIDDTFAYNLSLPIPESSKGKSVDIKFAEEISKLDSAQNVDNIITNTDTTVSVKNINHFTVFIIVYDSVPLIYPGSFPSLGYEATSTKEFGDHLKLSGTDRRLNKVTVGLTNWACENDFIKVGNSWAVNPNRVAEGCKTTPGSNFIHPITLNIYNIDKSSSTLKVGNKITTQTINATILYRPSRDTNNCLGTDKWYDLVSGCSNGYAFNIDFDFASLGIILPNEIIATIAYNTADYGESPIHVAGPYNSLNVSLSTSTPLKGSDVDSDAVFWNTSVASFYKDSGANGVGILRQDIGWSPYTPVIKVETQGVPVCNDASSFDNLTLGSVNGQGGWSSTGPYDQAIVSNSYGFDSFGCKTLRLSNSVASGSFGDQTFSFSVANEAGETSGVNDGLSGGIRQNHFEAQFDVASALITQQPGLIFSVSPDRGDGARMSYLRFEDQTDGVHIFFDDFKNDFIEKDIATINRTNPHTIKFVMDFVDGPANDIVQIYIDNVLKHTGTSWEDYFRDVEHNPTRTVDSLLFRVGGSSVPANSGKGFLFDNVTLSTSIISSDTTPPSVNFFDPTPGEESYTKGVITGHVIATDDVGMGSYYIRVWKNAFESGTVNLVKECSSAPGGNLLGKSQDVTCSLNTTLTDGKYVFSAQFLDSSSHWGTAFRTFYIDSIVPTATIGGVTPKTIYNGSTNINVHAIDSNYLKTELYRNGETNPFKTYTDEWFGLSWLADGNYRMVVIDKANNSAEYTFTIDKIAPNTPVHVLPSNDAFINYSDFWFDWDGIGDAVSYEIQNSTNPSVDGNSSFTNIMWTGDYQKIQPTISTSRSVGANGTWYWQVRAIDAAGNKSIWSTPWKVTIDKIAPTKPLSLGFKNPDLSCGSFTNIKNITIDWADSTDNFTVAGYDYSINYPLPNGVRGNWNTFFTQSQYSGSLNEGLHNIKVRAKDTAGNVSDWTDLCGITYDSIAPTLNDKTSFSGWHKTSVISTFNYTDNNGVISGNNPTCDIITEGSNQTCSVTPNVCDTAGNCNTAPVTSNPANLDFTAPKSIITTPTNTSSDSTIYINSWTGSILGSATDTLSGINGVKVSIKKGDKYFDGTNFTKDSEFLLTTNYSVGNWTYSGLTLPSDGTYILKSHVIDNAGNTENPYTLTIVLDKIISDVSISLDPTVGDASNGWYKTQPEITLTHTDANFDKIEYQWNSETGPWTTYSVPFKLQNEGGHILFYRAIDKAQNISKVGVKNIAWDQTDLEYGPQNISANPNPTSGSTSKIKWEFAKDNSGIDKYEVQWSLNGTNYSKTVGAGTSEVEIENLTEGKWTVKVIAFDRSGRTKDGSIDLRVDRSGSSAVQNQGAESNEVSTGAIVGVTNVESGTPAQGFTPEVLGETTTDNVIPTPTLIPSVSNVLGVSTENVRQWCWLWLLLLIPTYLIVRRLFKNNRKN